MTPGEKHTETTAKEALKLLGDDERTAVEAWIDDRERAARSTAATTELQRQSAVTFGITLGVGTVILALIALIMYANDAFDPKVCPTPEPCPAPKECPVCETPAALDWQEVMPVNNRTPIAQARYALTPKQECVSLGDTTLCAPLRTPAVLPPQVGP